MTKRQAMAFNILKECSWERWFAWRPVQIDGERVQFQWVYRRRHLRVNDCFPWGVHALVNSGWRASVLAQVVDSHVIVDGWQYWKPGSPHPGNQLSWPLHWRPRPRVSDATRRQIAESKKSHSQGSDQSPRQGNSAAPPPAFLEERPFSLSGLFGLGICMTTVEPNEDGPPSNDKVFALVDPPALDGATDYTLQSTTPDEVKEMFEGSGLISYLHDHESAHAFSLLLPRCMVTRSALYNPATAWEDGALLYDGGDLYWIVSETAEKAAS